MARIDADERPTLDAGLADEETTAVVGKQLAPGTNVGGYLVDGMLGRGGMGVVYVATHPLIGKRAAIKVLRPELSHEPVAVERFITEARAVNQIGHRNIVDIFDFGALPDGRHYYLMDLLEGESLRARLHRTGALHVSEAASVIDELASALIAAHGKGIIHRDLKPDNVFMLAVPGRWPEVRVLDWGLAKLLSPTTLFRTATGSVLGTPVYMSPEQARASDLVDARTDIYALGVVSYELLAGVVPFRGATSLATLLSHQEDEVPSLAARVPGLPEELVQLVEAMLAKEPSGRPTLAAVRTVLKRLKGTKIPTMTAAGLEVSLPPTRGDRAARDLDDMLTLDHDKRTEAQLRTADRRTRPPPAAALGVAPPETPETPDTTETTAPTAPTGPAPDVSPPSIATAPPPGPGYVLTSPRTITGVRAPTPPPADAPTPRSAGPGAEPPPPPLESQHSGIPLPPPPSLPDGVRARTPAPGLVPARAQSPSPAMSFPDISIEYAPDSQAGLPRAPTPLPLPRAKLAGAVASSRTSVAIIAGVAVLVIAIGIVLFLLV